MRLISFDVGIKNLAYCVFSIDGKSKAWSISEWNCANLIASPLQESEQVVCCQLIKAKKKTDPEHICGKKAKWYTPDSNEHRQAYCELHAKMHTEWIIPTSKNAASRIHKMKMNELEMEHKKLFPDTDMGNKQRKSYYVERILKYYDSNCFQSVNAGPIVKTKTASEVDLVTIGRAIKRQLDNDTSVVDITHVIIENQISTIASRMKTIQGMIAQYFIMRFGDNVSVEFVSSHNKLKGFTMPIPLCLQNAVGVSPALRIHHPIPTLVTSLHPLSGIVPDGDTEKTKSSYKANKSDGIAICRRFFDANNEMEKWKSDFDNSKKRDDLADCFLQGIWYMKTNKIIYYAEDLKINSVFVS
jgi:hypothetical protein